MATRCAPSRRHRVVRVRLGRDVTVYANGCAREPTTRGRRGRRGERRGGDWDTPPTPEYAETVAALHAQLVAIIEAAATTRV